jgi:hypothetical protein
MLWMCECETERMSTAEPSFSNPSISFSVLLVRAYAYGLRASDKAPALLLGLPLLLLPPPPPPFRAQVSACRAHLASGFNTCHNHHHRSEWFVLIGERRPVEQCEGI